MAPRRGSMSTSPSPSSCTSASRTGVRELPNRVASDTVRRRSPGSNSPERMASRNSSDTRRELVGLGVVGVSELKECIQNHAACPKASGTPRILHSKRATNGVWHASCVPDPVRCRPVPERCGPVPGCCGPLVGQALGLRFMVELIDRLRTALAEAGLERAVLSHPETLAHLCLFDPAVEEW